MLLHIFFVNISLYDIIFVGRFSVLGTVALAFAIGHAAFVKA